MAGLLEALRPKLNLVPTGDVRSPDPLVAVVRNLLMESGAKDLETQPYLLLARMADAMLEGLTVCDPRGTVVYVNTSLCRMLGMTQAEVIGRSATEFFAGIFARFVQLKPRPVTRNGASVSEVSGTTSQGAVLSSSGGRSQHRGFRRRICRVFRRRARLHRPDQS